MIRGSALRSRGIEPFLKELSDNLIHYLLGAETRKPEELYRKLDIEIAERTFPVEQLAKREFLSQSPEKYKKVIEQGGKPRRASLEVALKMNPVPKMGEQVAYYITVGDKKRAPDWQTARPLGDYDGEKQPYDPDYYLKKLKEWKKRYAAFLEDISDDSRQGELF